MSQKIHDMFCHIANRYDLTNDLLSIYIHRLWRKRAISQLKATSNTNLLDLCCGTGLFSLDIARLSNAPSKIIGLDIAEPMIKLAKQKHQESKLHNVDITFRIGDALDLPFESDFFDIITIGFGVRNYDDVSIGLKEAFRVLKPEGQIIILEFGEIESKIVSFLYTPYAKYVLPLLGALLTGNYEAYQYLHRTSLSFPGGNNFLPYLEKAGFQKARYEALMGGIAYVYSATK